MGDEVLEFAKAIGVSDLKAKYPELFKRHNYYFLGNNFFIIKISRSEKNPFWGLGKQFLDRFNTWTEKGGNYYFVALASNKSGWVLSKREILSQISDGSLSYSENQDQYKIHKYNLKDHNSFTSTDEFLRKIGIYP
jgi:hypothetical protein